MLWLFGKIMLAGVPRNLTTTTNNLQWPHECWPHLPPSEDSPAGPMYSMYSLLGIQYSVVWHSIVYSMSVDPICLLPRIPLYIYTHMYTPLSLSLSIYIYIYVCAGPVIWERGLRSNAQTFHTMLYYTIIYYAILYYAMLYTSYILYYAVLYTMLCCTILQVTMSFRAPSGPHRTPAHRPTFRHGWTTNNNNNNKNNIDNEYCVCMYVYIYIYIYTHSFDCLTIC